MSQEAKMLHNTNRKGLPGAKHTSLLGPFISCKEKEVFWKQPMVLYSQHFIFFITCVCAQEARALDNKRPEKFASYKHRILLGTLVSYEENELLESTNTSFSS